MISSIESCVKQLALYANKMMLDNCISLTMLQILFYGAEGFQRSNKREAMAMASTEKPSASHFEYYRLGRYRAFSRC